MTKCRPLLFTAGIAIWFVTVGCEIDTKAHVDGKNPPTIKLSGNGKINFLRVMQEPFEANFFEKAKGGLWQIEPRGDTREKMIFQYPPIKYGEVPPGFVQVVPEDNSPPPTLEEGKTYRVWAPTYNANGGDVSFAIESGKSVEVR